VISRNHFALFRLLSILPKLFSSASMVLVTGVVSVEGSLPLWETTCTTRIISVFALSLENFLLMSASSLFCVNGVSTTALLDASLEKTTIRREFAARCDLSDGDTALVSAPIGDKTVSSPVVVTIADHVHDVAVGADWLRSVTQDRLCFRQCTVFLKTLICSHV
jgi:hypothetical protein